MDNNILLLLVSTNNLRANNIVSSSRKMKNISTKVNTDDTVLQYSDEHLTKIGKVFISKRWTHRKYVKVISFTDFYAMIVNEALLLIDSTRLFDLMSSVGNLLQETLFIFSPFSFSWHSSPCIFQTCFFPLILEDVEVDDNENRNMQDGWIHYWPNIAQHNFMRWIL